MVNQTVGLTLGNFDLFHFGHLKYLLRCKERCHKLIVAVNSDRLIQRSKGDGWPIFPARERRLIVDNLACVNSTCVVDKEEDLITVLGMFDVNKIFERTNCLKFDQETNGYGASTELVVIKDIPGLPEATQLIETIQNRFAPDQKKDGDSSSSNLAPSNNS